MKRLKYQGSTQLIYTFFLGSVFLSLGINLGDHSCPYFLKKNQYDNIGHFLVLILIKKRGKAEAFYFGQYLLVPLNFFKNYLEDYS